MDIASLLCGLRPACAAAQRAKLRALQFAHARWAEIEPEIEFGAFVKRIPASIRGQVFGSPAHDFYTSALLSCVAQKSGAFDAFAAAALNRLVLQLNFQTRFIGSRGAPETFVLDGARELFAPSMANGNAILGFQISQDTSWTSPEWSRCAHIDLAEGALFSRPLDAIHDVMQALQRTRIGCLALALPDEQSPVIKLRDRYASLRANFRSDTYLVVLGPARRVLQAAAALEGKSASAVISSRVYDDVGDQRAIVIASGMDGIPKVDV